jgi:MFS family permease
LSSQPEFIPKIFITLFFAVFSTLLGVGLVVPLLPVYAHDLGAGAFQISLIFAAFSLSRTIFVPFFGRRSDLKGKKPILTIGMLLYFVFSICFILSRGVETLILIRLGQGLASAMILPVAQAYVGLITPKDKEGLVMGLFNLSLYGGLSVGPLLGGFIKDWLSIQFSFISMGALSLVAFFLCQILLPDEKKGTLPGGGRAKKSMPFLKMVKEKSILSLLAFRVCFTMNIGTVWTFLPLIASTENHLSSTDIGIVIMINVLVGGILQAPLGYITDKFNKKVLITSGGLLAALSLYYMSRAETFSQLFITNGLLGVAAGLSFPAVMALGVIEGRRLNAMGSIMGLLTMAHSIGMLAGPLFGGLLADFFSFSAVFVAGILIAAIGTLILVLFYPNPRQVQGLKSP